jgi:ABC-type phosphate transport system substrate-binding protein
MITLKKSLFVLTMSCASLIANAEVAVIVNSSNANATMSNSDISRIFLGKSSKFPDGSAASAIDQNAGNATRQEFNDKVLGKSESQLKSYWSRLIFTGKGSPPKQLGDDAAVKAAVAADANAIGFIDSASVDGSVKVVGKF